MADNPDGMKPSYHEVPAYKYLFVWETAIHKRFFKWWTIILFLTTYVGTRFLNLDLYLAKATFNVYMSNMWLLIPTGFVIVGAFYIWRHELKREARLKLERQQRWR